MTLMKAQLFFGVVSVFVASRRVGLPSQNKSEYCRCPSLAATGARRSAVRHWHDGVLAGDHLMVRGQDRAVNTATLCIQIYYILCERVTEESHYCVACYYGNMALYLLTCVI